MWVDAVKNSPYKWLVLEKPVYPFSTASDADLAKMLDAYYNGDITIDDIKTKNSVGDTRSVSLSAMSATGVGESHRAQTVEFVIGDFEHDDLATSINGHTKSAMTLLQKDCLMDATSASNLNNGAYDTEKGYMNNSKTNSGGWKSCARRIWCNNVYYNALPSTIQSLVKTVNKKSSTGGGSSSGTETTADKIFLASEIEVHGTTTYSVSGEGSQYQYYKNSTSNKYKNPKWSSSNCVTQAWWHRSPSTTESTAFLVVDSGGVLFPHYSDYGRGIAPCLCI